MITLRDYQETDVERILESLNAGKRTMYRLPTGGGKTEIGLIVAKKLVEQDIPVVWLAHRQELIEQAIRRAMSADLIISNTYATGVYAAGCINIQSVGKARNNPPPKGAALIIDESHHATAKTWAKLIQEHEGMVLGMTATPWRLSNKEGFEHLYDELILGPDYAELIDNKHLVGPTVIAPPSDSQLALSGKNNEIGSTGDYQMNVLVSRLGRAMYDIPLHYWREYCRNRRTLIYAGNQAVAVKIARQLKTEGARIGLLLSDKEMAAGVPKDIETDRERVVQMFGAHELDAVVNVQILTEGYDCPGADAVIVGRPTKSLALMRQMAGRIARPADGKSDALLVDCGASVRDPQVGWPTGEYDWALTPRKRPSKDADAPVVDCKKCEAVSPAAARACVSCGAPFGQICERCHEFRYGWFFDFNGPPHCDDCQSGIDEIRRLKLEEELKNKPGRWAMNPWRYATRKYGDTANWEHVDLLRDRAEWGIIVPTMLPIDEPLEVRVDNAKMGQVMTKTVIPRWRGKFFTEIVTLCESLRYPPKVKK